MNSEEFVNAIRKPVIQARMIRYSKILKDTLRKPGLDPIWAEIFAGWDTMTEPQQNAMMTFVRLAVAETVAALFGIIDNVEVLEKHRERFELRYGKANEKVSGDLVDYFWAAEEDDPL
jgi:hypothetical protein